jgi:hypothetical protein
MGHTLKRCAAVVLGLATLLTACGPAEELELAEGQSLDGLRYCAYGCFVNTFCAELFLKDTGRSPALCVPDNICDRFTCANGGTCATFDTFPAEVRCVD